MSSQKHKETHVLDNTETIWKHFNIHKRKKKNTIHMSQHFRKHSKVLENSTF